MKITLTPQQWKTLGEKAGWMPNTPKPPKLKNLKRKQNNTENTNKKLIKENLSKFTNPITTLNLED